MSEGTEGERHWLWGVLLRITIAFAVLALVTHTLVRPFVIPSGSMEPTLMTGDRVFAQVAGVDGDDLERGDVVVFGHGETWGDARLDETHPVKDVLRYAGDLLGAGPSHTAHTVKRVIGLPGETLSCCDAQGRVLVDGEPLDEPYVRHDLPFLRDADCSREGAPQRCFPEVTVPDDSYLVLGDNRANSADSVMGCRGRGTGPCEARFVHADRVVGTLGWRWWPLPPGGAERD